MTKKTAPSFNLPQDRASRAMSFVKENEETKPIEKPKKAPELDGRYKSTKRYMDQHGISDISSIDFARLNCDIPKELHVWLNVFAKTNDEYGSMTEVVIDQLGKFAKERGFVAKKK
ncbi:hypothetical protein [Acinetobacter pittii]|uniref:hypothetical protein n=1 Tax=Acinetobacter pittii TaxID=48296 RepID=UPI001580C9D9|nr:hypothetical protein [Acinetobacter pittii]NUF45017.1 hypothetical protein [Acinetobacter pittii]